jgi:hypothetical protein
MPLLNDEASDSDENVKKVRTTGEPKNDLREPEYVVKLWNDLRERRIQK